MADEETLVQVYKLSRFDYKNAVFKIVENIQQRELLRHISIHIQRQSASTQAVNMADGESTLEGLCSQRSSPPPASSTNSRLPPPPEPTHPQHRPHQPSLKTLTSAASIDKTDGESNSSLTSETISPRDRHAAPSHLVGGITDWPEHHADMHKDLELAKKLGSW